MNFFVVFSKPSHTYIWVLLKTVKTDPTDLQLHVLYLQNVVQILQEIMLTNACSYFSYYSLVPNQFMIDEDKKKVGFQFTIKSFVLYFIFIHVILFHFYGALLKTML